MAEPQIPQLTSSQNTKITSLFRTMVGESVGGMCNFLGSVSPQQKFEMADQCYSLVTAQLYLEKQRIVHPRAASKGETSIHLGFLLLFTCLLPTLSLPYANWAAQEGGMFVSPEVFTLFCAFSFVLSLQTFTFLCLLATTILDSFFFF